MYVPSNLDNFDLANYFSSYLFFVTVQLQVEDSTLTVTMGNASQRQLFDASRRGDQADMRNAIRAGADPNAHAEPHGWTCLHAAAAYNQEEACRVLVSRTLTLHGPENRVVAPWTLICCCHTTLKKTLDRHYWSGRCQS